MHTSLPTLPPSPPTCLPTYLPTYLPMHTSFFFWELTHHHESQWTISADQYRRNAATEVLFVSLAHLSDAIVAADTDTLPLRVGVDVGDVLLDVAGHVKEQLESEPLQWHLLLKEPTVIMSKLELKLKKVDDDDDDDDNDKGNGDGNGNDDGSGNGGEAREDAGAHVNRTARAMLGVLYGQRARLFLVMGQNDHAAKDVDRAEEVSSSVPSFLRSFVPSFLRSFVPSFLC